MESALYLGRLRHRRFEPREHAFEYPVYMAFLDIDRLPELMSGSRFSSYNRWNWTGYDERDHFGDPAEPLRRRLEEDARRQGVALPDGQIFLLTHLRYFGYVFNPVSFFYCYDRAGRLEMMLGEVNNTFGETHNYWLTRANDGSEKTGSEHTAKMAVPHRYRTVKRMHVSPFQRMELEYDWIFTPPGERLVAHMNTLQDGRANFDATLQLERRPWDAKHLVRALAAYPFITLRVIAGIHWEALRLWAKGVPVHTHPAELERARTVEAAKGKLAG
jgi:DUF1365 family protein